MEVGTLTFTAEGFTADSKARLLTEHYEGAWRFHEAIFQDREADYGKTLGFRQQRQKPSLGVDY